MPLLSGPFEQSFLANVAGRAAPRFCNEDLPSYNRGNATMVWRGLTGAGRTLPDGCFDACHLHRFGLVAMACEGWASNGTSASMLLTARNTGVVLGALPQLDHDVFNYADFDILCRSSSIWGIRCGPLHRARFRLVCVPGMHSDYPPPVAPGGHAELRPGPAPSLHVCLMAACHQISGISRPRSGLLVLLLQRCERSCWCDCSRCLERMLTRSCLFEIQGAWRRSPLDGLRQPGATARIASLKADP